MKKLVVVFVLLFAISFLSATVFDFSNSIQDGSTTTNNFAEIYFLISETSLTDFIFNFQETNYSLFDSSLVLMLNLDNNSAIGENDSLVVDSSVYKNNGTADNISFSTGKYNNSIILVNNSLINFSDSDAFHSDEFTISFWIKTQKFSIKQIVANGDSTYILLTSGEVYSVGYNSVGQLGIGSTTDAITPTKISGFNFSLLADSGYPGDGQTDHMCGVLVNGTAMCWGYGANGQIGDNTTTQRTSPKAVLGNYNFSNIYVGRWNSCGLLFNGTLLCWGANSYGQIGDNTTTQRNVPTPQIIFYNFSQVSLGDGSTCGVLINGTGLCWGRNSYGQVGANITSSETGILIPTFVYGTYNFSKIFSGNEKVCGILTNGSVMCWGGQGSGGGFVCGGGLGDNTCNDSSIPVSLYGDYTFSYLESNYYGYCGILTNGSVMCWGGGRNGVLGNGNTSKSLVPVMVNGDYNFSSISVGNGHSCGILQNESISCWGANSHNQLGKGISTSYFVYPILFDYGTFSNGSYSQLVMGTGHVCGLLENGSALCWGNNEYNALGDDTNESKDIPTPVYGNYNFSFLSSRANLVCGLLENGSALCWGANAQGQVGANLSIEQVGIPTPVYGNYNFSTILSGANSACGMLHNKTVLCWGSNQYGSLGNGSTGGRSNVPIPVSGNYNFSSLYSSNGIFCGLLENGSALCWGLNNQGQLGDNSIINRNTSTPVYGNYNFSSLSLGVYNSCGLLENGSALCWGDNAFGQVGDNTTTDRKIPTPVYGNYNFSNIAIGQYYICGVLTNSSALCWGTNVDGRLGDGTLTQRNIPTFVNYNKNFSLIFCGQSFTYGVLTDGTIVSFGSNSYGQQLFSIFDSKIPSLGFYKGNLFGKTTESFRVGSGFDGGIFGYSSKGFNYLELDSNWNLVVLSFDGTIGKIYKNGELYNTFTSPYLNYFNDTSALTIGNETNAQIDEVQMWNRTLSDSEIKQVYKSNLQQINSTAYQFYTNQSSLSEGTYTYKFYVKNILGNWNVSGLRSFIVKFPVEVVASSSSPGATYKPTNESLQEGYSRNFVKNQKVEITINGEKEIITINKILENEVQFSVSGNNYSVSVNSTKKLDLNSDGVYDLQISVNKIYTNGIAQMEFKLINEKIPTGEKESAGEQTQNETPKEKSNNLILIIIGGVVLIGIISLMLNVKHKKRRYSLYGF